MINNDILTSEDIKSEKLSELAVLLKLAPISSAKIQDSEKLEYIKFMLSALSVESKLFQKCGGGDVQVAMARNLVKIKNKKRN